MQRPGSVAPLVEVDQFTHRRSSKMMDAIMLAIALGFFVLSVGYCYACDRL